VGVEKKSYSLKSILRGRGGGTREEGRNAFSREKEGGRIGLLSRKKKERERTDGKGGESHLLSGGKKTRLATRKSTKGEGGEKFSFGSSLFKKRAPGLQGKRGKVNSEEGKEGGGNCSREGEGRTYKKNRIARRGSGTATILRDTEILLDKKEQGEPCNLRGGKGKEKAVAWQKGDVKKRKKGASPREEENYLSSSEEREGTKKEAFLKKKGHPSPEGEGRKK